MWWHFTPYNSGSPASRVVESRPLVVPRRLFEGEHELAARRQRCSGRSPSARATTGRPLGQTGQVGRLFDVGVQDLEAIIA